jgi:deoxyribonuclease (pyrimidine dimer)
MRINCVPPSILSDAHLIAEIREIKMLPKSLVRSLKSKKGVNFRNIPVDYTLNTGHGIFFYNKIPYIEQRFKELIAEAVEVRHFMLEDLTKTLYDAKFDYSIINQFKHNMIDEWVPNFMDQKINIDRIMQRIHEKITDHGKPNFYKYRSNNRSLDEWISYYESYVNMIFKKKGKRNGQR